MQRELLVKGEGGLMLVLPCNRRQVGRLKIIFFLNISVCQVDIRILL